VKRSDGVEQYEELLRHVDCCLLWALSLAGTIAMSYLSPVLSNYLYGWLISTACLHGGASHLISVPNLLANIVIIIPFNAICVVSFVLLTPIRILWNHIVTYAMAPRMDPSVHMSFWTASRDKWVAACGPSLKTLFKQDMDALSPTAARALYDGYGGWDTLRQWVQAHIPSWLLKSLVGRLVFCMVGTPTGTWFLADMNWLQLLPLHPTTTNPKVTVVLPSCAFLNIAKAKFGEKLGNAKCINE